MIKRAWARRVHTQWRSVRAFVGALKRTPKHTHKTGKQNHREAVVCVCVCPSAWVIGQAGCSAASRSTWPALTRDSSSAHVAACLHNAAELVRSLCNFRSHSPFAENHVMLIISALASVGAFTTPSLHHPSSCLRF